VIYIDYLTGSTAELPKRESINPGIGVFVERHKNINSGKAQSLKVQTLFKFLSKSL